MLFDACLLLVAVCCYVFVVRGLLRAVSCSLFVACWFLFVVRCALFVVCCLLCDVAVCYMLSVVC